MPNAPQPLADALQSVDDEIARTEARLADLRQARTALAKVVPARRIELAAISFGPGEIFDSGPPSINAGEKPTGTLKSFVRSAVRSLPVEFTSIDVRDWLARHEPDLPVGDRSSIPKVLSRMAARGDFGIQLIEAGRGRRPPKYRRSR